jgi:DNA topoisomerase-1
MNITRSSTKGPVNGLESKHPLYFGPNKSKIHDSKILDRIKKLGIPPAWTNVKIADSDTEYLQVTGTDEKGRTQYIYHPMWVELSKIEKYERLANFQNRLPLLIQKIKQKLSGPIDLTSREYLIALLFRIMSLTLIRIGNECYADENNTYGLTTLLKKHVKIEGNVIKFSFVGKKSIKQNISFSDSNSLRAIKELMKIPGNSLFQTTGHESIKSNDMNKYIKDIIGEEFTCKDFRTHGANVLFLELLCKQELPSNKTQSKKILNKVFDQVAEKLGHTRAICKKSYVMQSIPEQFIENPHKFIGQNPTKLMKTLLD